MIDLVIIQVRKEVNFLPGLSLSASVETRLFIWSQLYSMLLVDVIVFWSFCVYIPIFLARISLADICITRKTRYKRGIAVAIISMKMKVLLIG